MKKKLLYTGGILALLFVMLHLAFPKMFDWANDLSHLHKVNRSILWVLHIATMYMLVMSAIICFKLASKSVFTITERIVLFSYAGFYILRIVLGPIFFGSATNEIIIWVVCLLTALCYIIPAVTNNKTIDITR